MHILTDAIVFHSHTEKNSKLNYFKHVYIIESVTESVTRAIASRIAQE